MWASISGVAALVLLSQVLSLLSAAGPILFVVFAVAMMPLSVGVNLLRRTLYSKRLLLEELAAFDLQHARCRLDADRQFVHQAIEGWYGSMEAFTEYVRGPLQQELLHSSSNFTVPSQYYPLIVLPYVAGSLDEVVGLCSGGAPWTILLSHVFAHTIGMSTWIITGLEVTAYLSYRWAPARHSPAWKIIQSVLTFLAAALTMAMGATLSLASLRRGLAQSVAYCLISLTITSCVLRVYRLRPEESFWKCCQKQQHPSVG